MTDQTSQSLIALAQGVVYGLYLLTRDDTTVKWQIFCDLAFIVGAEATWKDTLKRAKKHFKLPKILTTWKSSLTDPNGKKNDYSLQSIECNVPGKIVFSLLLPATYSRKIKDVTIQNGILTNGQLTKKTMNIITEHLYIEYGQDAAVKYIDGANFMCNMWNTIHGYTFGIRDCLNFKQKEIDLTLKETYQQVDYINSMPISNDEKEVLIRESLDKATQIGQKIAKDGMYGGQNNAMAIATCSEAKGSFVNLSYISCCLGLQTVMGKRYAPELCEGTRVLPCFKEGDMSPQARGFLEDNFYKSLSPIGLIFHGWSSRKGLVDTAVTTKSSGYNHRQYSKKMENAHIDILGCVRDCDNSIIDFQYGEMGFDPNECYYTNGVAFFIDLKELVLCINGEYLTKEESTNVEYTEFSDRQFEFINKHLLILGEQNAEPIQATKKRIMYVIRQQLQGVKIIVNKWCVESFFNRLRRAFDKSRIQPGNMVGFKAACSIGSVSTQDALNAFHSSGTSSKATTIGLPRMNELTNLSKEPKITGGSFRYDDEILKETADREDEQIELKKRKMKRVEELRKVFEYKTFEDFGKFDILKTGKSVTNVWEGILDIHSTFKKPNWWKLWFETMERDEPQFENDFILRFVVDKKMMYTYNVTMEELMEILEKEYEDYCIVLSPISQTTIYIYPNFDNVDLPKTINGELTTWKYYWIRDVCQPTISELKVCGISGIKKIFYSHENVVDYQGHNFRELMQVPNVIFSSLQTDFIWEVVQNLGIHMAYIFLYEELTKCLSKQLNPSHLMVLARTMTDSGYLSNITRNGINGDRVGVLTKASFETPMEHLLGAAVWTQNDNTKSLASSYFMGTTLKIGTQYCNFKLLNKR